MTSGMGLTIRRLVEDDYQAFSDVVAAAFLHDPDPSDAAFERPLFDLDRVHGVFEESEPIGTSGALTRDIGVPGGVLSRPPRSRRSASNPVTAGGVC